MNSEMKFKLIQTFKSSENPAGDIEETEYDEYEEAKECFDAILNEYPFEEEKKLSSDHIILTNRNLETGAWSSCDIEIKLFNGCRWEGSLLVAYDENGDAEVIGEAGSDADFDNYAVQVQNGDGYYDEDGKFHWYRTE